MRAMTTVVAIAQAGADDFRHGLSYLLHDQRRRLGTGFHA